jgi:RNA polymerase sigma-70 factor (ECF subfamily)
MQTLPPTLESLTPLSDEEIVTRIRAGDAAVFELLMRRYNQRLFRVARGVVHDNDEAEDIVQETYLRAYAHLSQFQGRSSLATWMSRIAFHEAIRRRRLRRRARVSEGLDPDTLSNGRDPGDSMERTETGAMLADAIDLLPAGLRVIVMMRLVEGLSTRETAESLHLTEANVKTSLHRARGMLFETIQRRTIPEFRRQFAFDGERCDRIVAGVFQRLGPVSNCRGEQFRRTLRAMIDNDAP